MIKKLVVCVALVLVGVCDESYRTTSRMLAVAGGCEPCQMHADIQAANIEGIKLHILNKLGLKAPPNITGRPRPRIPMITQFMNEYGVQSEQKKPVQPGVTYHDEIDDYTAKTETIFVFPERAEESSHYDKDAVLRFKFSEITMKHRVKKAKLYLWLLGTDGKEGTAENSGGIVTIILRQILRESAVSGQSLGVPLVITRPRPTGRRGSWVNIKVKDMVGEWFRYPHNNLGVHVEILDGEENVSANLKNRIVEMDPSSEYAPHLKIDTEEPDSRRGARTRRSLARDCEVGGPDKNCCRYQLTINFEQFGWDWIIAPKTYDANYCAGSCPYSFMQKFPNTHLVNMASPPNYSGPCCIPRKLSSISMLFFDSQQQIIFSHLPGMSVEKCGCS